MSARRSLLTPRSKAPAAAAATAASAASPAAAASVASPAPAPSGRAVSVDKLFESGDSKLGDAVASQAAANQLAADSAAAPAAAASSAPAPVAPLSNGHAQTNSDAPAPSSIANRSSPPRLTAAAPAQLNSTGSAFAAPKAPAAVRPSSAPSFNQRQPVAVKASPFALQQPQAYGRPPWAAAPRVAPQPQQLVRPSPFALPPTHQATTMQRHYAPPSAFAVAKPSTPQTFVPTQPQLPPPPPPQPRPQPPPQPSLKPHQQNFIKCAPQPGQEALKPLSIVFAAPVPRKSPRRPAPVQPSVESLFGEDEPSAATPATPVARPVAPCKEPLRVVATEPLQQGDTKEMDEEDVPLGALLSSIRAAPQRPAAEPEAGAQLKDQLLAVAKSAKDARASQSQSDAKASIDRIRQATKLMEADAKARGVLWPPRNLKRQAESPTSSERRRVRRKLSKSSRRFSADSDPDEGGDGEESNASSPPSPPGNSGPGFADASELGADEDEEEQHSERVPQRLLPAAELDVSDLISRYGPRNMKSRRHSIGAPVTEYPEHDFKPLVSPHGQLHMQTQRQPIRSEEVTPSARGRGSAARAALVDPHAAFVEMPSITRKH